MEKNNTGIIIILIIIILGLVGYIVYDKVIIKETKSNNNKNTTTEKEEINNDNTLLSEGEYENIARGHIPNLLSLINQENGGYAFCGETLPAEGFTDNNLLYRASATYKSLEELKSSLKSMISEELYNKYYKENTDIFHYIEKDNKLYCSYIGTDGYGTKFVAPSSVYSFKDFNLNVSDLKSDSFKAKVEYKYESIVDFTAKFTYEFDFIKSGDNWLITNYTENKEEYDYEESNQ